VRELQSLLFGPNEKTAVVIRQLLQQLGTGVRWESDVPGAVRQLATERFDFLIVECDNTENGRLLLKSAHSSACNKKALVVAVVDGKQVLMGFRLGADFVLTKPIAVAQATGVLRIVQNRARQGQQIRPEATATGEMLREESVTGGGLSVGIDATQHPATSKEDPQDSQPAAIRPPTVRPLRAKAAAATADSGVLSHRDESLEVVRHLKQTSAMKLQELETEPVGCHDEAQANLKSSVETGLKSVRGKDRFAIVSLALLAGAALAGWYLGFHRGQPEWVSWLLMLLKRITG
jgi:DNA-binding response OmpR family regulator